MSIMLSMLAAFMSHLLCWLLKKSIDIGIKAFLHIMYNLIDYVKDEDSSNMDYLVVNLKHDENSDILCKSTLMTESKIIHYIDLFLLIT